MDLFGRKRLEQELKNVNESLFDILKQLLNQQRRFEKLQERLAETEKELAVAQERVTFLKTQRDNLINSAPHFSPTPLHTTEEEEDTRFLGDIGLMTEKEVATLLEQTGFENTEVEFN